MKKKKKRTKNYSEIADHKRNRKKLTPPLATIGPLNLSSWRDERLPNVLWAAMLTLLERDDYLAIFRSVAKAAAELKETLEGRLDHLSLAALSDVEFNSVFDAVAKSAKAKDVLRPILLLDTLPGKNHWKRILGDDPNSDAIATLAEAIHKTSMHQSQPATDVRWVRVLSMILGGKMKFDASLSERVREILQYPDRGDQKAVRPSIRANEMMFAQPTLNPHGSWADEFWRECWENTSCIPLSRSVPETSLSRDVLEQLGLTYQAVADHFYAQTKNTNLDPRKDTAFGLTFYALNLAMTLNGSSSRQRAEGRLVIRTLVECVITLAYLVRKDEKALWEGYRNYGAGQAKLAFLKLADLESDDLPSYVTTDELEILANEDIWQEFQDIDLGHWAGIDLRRMSEAASMKPIYDKYYGWPSAYVHGHWAAVRDTTFVQCANPLHRLHRIPAPPRLDMGDVAEDSIRLCNLALESLATAYPPFKQRLKFRTNGETAPTEKPKRKRPSDETKMR